MKRLVFLCPALSGKGGTETVLVKVVNYLSTKYQVEVVLGSKPSDETWLNAINDGVKLSRIKHDGKLGRTTQLLKTLVNLKNDDRLIVLGVNMIKPAAKFRRCFFKRWKITSWIHYSLTHQDMFDPKKILFADDHWAISSAIRQQMLDMGIDSSDVHLIYNPIEKQTKVNEPLKQDKLKLTYIGRQMLDGQKNLRELFKGVASYPGKIQLDLFGAQFDKENINQYVSQLKIKDECIFHDWTNNVWREVLDEVRPDAIVLTSRYEGLPMVLLEAMSYGIPCLSANFEGIADVVRDGENGYIYEMGDVQSLVEKMTKIKSSHFSTKVVKNSLDQYYEDRYCSRLYDLVSM